MIELIANKKSGKGNGAKVLTAVTAYLDERDVQARARDVYTASVGNAYIIEVARHSVYNARNRLYRV